MWWGNVSDRPNQGTRLALTLFVNGLFPRIILIRASQDLAARLHGDYYDADE